MTKQESASTNWPEDYLPGSDIVLDAMIAEGAVINRRQYLLRCYPTPPPYWGSELEEQVPDCIQEPAWTVPWDIPIGDPED